MSSAEYKRAKYREARADPVAFEKLREKQARNYQKKKQSDPDFLSKQAERRKPKRYLGDGMMKVRCRQATQNAIQAGTLIKGDCEVCGSKTVDAHHDDYSDPMNVRWLCPTHHAEHHSRLWCERNGINLAALQQEGR